MNAHGVVAYLGGFGSDLHKFRPDGTGIVQAVFVQWINGKQELVWPKDFATAPLSYPAPPFAKR